MGPAQKALTDPGPLDRQGPDRLRWRRHEVKTAIMQTYPTKDDKSGRLLAFEIENAYVSPATIGRILAAVDGVTGIRVRRPFGKWEHVHVWFRYAGSGCVVMEPFGDNSRYWIGPGGDESPVDCQPIEAVFTAYRPPLLRELISDLVTLRFLRRLGGGK